MRAIVEDITAANVIAPLEANMVAFWLAYGRASGSSFHATPDLTWVYTGIPASLFNGVLSVSLPAEAVDAVVEQLRVKIRERGAPVQWWIGPRSKPDHLEEILLGHAGLHRSGEAPGMAIPLAGLGDTPMLPQLTIEKVVNREMQSLFARIVGVGTGFRASAVDELVRLEATLDERQYQGQLRYIGFLDGRPVATAAMTLDAGVAGIYAVATLPEARGKGVGRAMTARPLLQARELGYRVGTLQASPMGYPLYRKMGFQEVCRYTLYVQSA